MWAHFRFFVSVEKVELDMSKAVYRLSCTRRVQRKHIQLSNITQQQASRHSEKHCTYNPAVLKKANFICKDLRPYSVVQNTVFSWSRGMWYPAESISLKHRCLKSTSTLRRILRVLQINVAVYLKVYTSCCFCFWHLNVAAEYLKKYIFILISLEI